MWVGLQWLMWDAGFFERSNKFSGPVKREKFLDFLSGYELVWKDSDVRIVWGTVYTFFVCYSDISKHANNVLDNALLNNCLSQNCDLCLLYCVETDIKLSVSVYRLTVSGCSCKWPYHRNLMLYAIRIPL